VFVNTSRKKTQNFLCAIAKEAKMCYNKENPQKGNGYEKSVDHGRLGRYWRGFGACVLPKWRQGRLYLS
jgi:hypothetical protein